MNLNHVVYANDRGESLDVVLSSREPVEGVSASEVIEVKGEARHRLLAVLAELELHPLPSGRHPTRR